MHSAARSNSWKCPEATIASNSHMLEADRQQADLFKDPKFADSRALLERSGLSGRSAAHRERLAPPSEALHLFLDRAKQQFRPEPPGTASRLSRKQWRFTLSCQFIVVS
jgi:hypothetical protein